MTRLLLYALVAIVALCLAGAGLAAYQQHRATHAVTRATQAHAATVAAGQRPARAFDSTFYGLAGERREAARTRLITQKQYDSLRRLFPAAGLELPAQPARYGATR